MNYRFKKSVIIVFIFGELWNFVWNVEKKLWEDRTKSFVAMVAEMPTTTA